MEKPHRKSLPVADAVSREFPNLGGAWERKVVLCSGDREDPRGQDSVLRGEPGAPLAGRVRAAAFSGADR